MVDLSTADDATLAGVLAGHGAAPWRAAQLRRAAWRPQVGAIGEIAELPLDLREQLGAELRFSAVEVVEVAEADSGATLKLLCGLSAGEGPRVGGGAVGLGPAASSRGASPPLEAAGLTVETVAMETPARHQSRRRSTVCVSTQVGCAVGCPFCATGQMGLRRSCSAAEIVDQVRAAARELARRGLGPVTHVVYMGMGEPLANLDATVASIRVLTAAGISPRRITVSTSGIVPAIDQLADAGLPVTLAISLHAADDALRDRLVPINRAHPLESLIESGIRYSERTGRRLSIEWCLIGGINDSREQAEGLRRLARRARAHVNVIPMNHIEGSPWGPPDPATTRAFLEVLEGANVTVRDTRGASTDAACGQLRASLERRRALRADGTLAPPRRPVRP